MTDVRMPPCGTLLQTIGIGRVAWATAAGRAVVLPVNFVLDGEAVVIKTSRDGMADAVEHDRVISFEADDG
ncbi:pyridoxamine 5'-phosphate oxidase family protein [Nonomuraea sp. B12E4]|uniref:pyridoxamine 5'-phosphate oxidase family protein n=1 Tax=Nonomuraea sp. B12E4 TaxID=3153564 RepID=UPI00325EC94F